VTLAERRLKFPVKTHELQQTMSPSIYNRAKAAAEIAFALLCIAFLANNVSAQNSTDTSFHTELYYEDIKSLQQQLVQRSLTTRQLARRFIERIHALDQAGPSIHSVIELNPDALAIASKIDGESTHDRLHGIPILVKDNIDTGDHMLTSVGSLALTEPAPQDAEVVARLRAAGALILGKTNPSEWVNFRDHHGISGWSARGGQTRNPYALDRSPCSSSAGSAAAVAAGFAVAALGTETDGSILCPASMNGIVGIKPIWGWLAVSVSYHLARARIQLAQWRVA
jgi:amidase